MPFNRPSLEDIENDLVASIDAGLDATDPRVRRSVLGVLARTLAGGLHLLYGFVEWITRQAFPWSAEAEYLDEWASIWGIDRAEAVAATGTVRLSGTAATVIAAGTRLRAADRQEYATDAEATVGAAGTVDADVTAVTPGADGNADDAAKLTLVSPVAGVESGAVAAGAIAGGEDRESDASLRQRLVTRLGTTPRGGTAADYVQWATSGHASVTRAWARALARGLGTVNVYLMTDDATDNGIPTGAVVKAVQGYIDNRRPVTADVDVIAPTPVELDVTVRDVTPGTQSVHAAIEAELADLVRRESEPGGTILVSHIREAISVAAGETDHVLVSPLADVTHTAAQIAVIGEITFTGSS